MAATKKDKLDSRKKVLDSAAVEFAAHGFAGARIDRIAKRTRLNVNMLYYHFGSKRELYRAVLESIYEEASRILDVTSSERNPTEAALAMYVDFLVDNPRFADVLVRELLDGATHLKAIFKQRPELFRRVHAGSRKLLDQAMKSGYLRQADLGLTVFSLTSSLCFLTAIRPAYAAFARGKSPEGAAWKAHLVQLLFDGLKTR